TARRCGTLWRGDDLHARYRGGNMTRITLDPDRHQAAEPGGAHRAVGRGGPGPRAPPPRPVRSLPGPGGWTRPQRRGGGAPGTGNRSLHHGPGPGPSGKALMFTVEWVVSALNALTALWTAADSAQRRAITAATHQIDILFVPPPGVIYRVDAQAATATVL